MDCPKVAQPGPYVIEVTPRRYAWCACGLSDRDPYCDGSHRDCGMKPIIVTIEEPQKVAWCGCKQTQTPPFCDGSHKSL